MKLLSYQNDVFEIFGNKMKEMEEALVEKDALLKHKVEKVKHLEERQHCLIEETCSCNKCDFKTYHKTSLKIHTFKSTVLLKSF